MESIDTSILWQNAIKQIHPQFMAGSTHQKFLKHIQVDYMTFGRYTDYKRYRDKKPYNDEKYKKFLAKCLLHFGRRAILDPVNGLPVFNSERLSVELVKDDSIDLNPSTIFSGVYAYLQGSGNRYKGDYLLIGQNTLYARNSKESTGYSRFYVWPVRIHDNGLVQMRESETDYFRFGLVHYDGSCLSFLFICRGQTHFPQPSMGHTIFRVEGRQFRKDLHDNELGIFSKRTANHADTKAEECVLIRISDVFDTLETSLEVQYENEESDIKCKSGEIKQITWDRFKKLYKAEDGLIQSAFMYLHKHGHYIRIDQKSNGLMKSLLESQVEDGSD